MNSKHLKLINGQVQLAGDGFLQNLVHGFQARWLVFVFSNHSRFNLLVLLNFFKLTFRDIKHLLKLEEDRVLTSRFRLLIV